MAKRSVASASPQPVGGHSGRRRAPGTLEQQRILAIAAPAPGQLGMEYDGRRTRTTSCSIRETSASDERSPTGLRRRSGTRRRSDNGGVTLPRDDRVFTVLVACPSDVQNEAELVRKAVEEVNLGMASLQAARLEVINWRTHASPGIGSDPQDVINRQLPEDYDIFLGVMWARFGTATPRAGSGTEEEFERALTRYQDNSSNVKILFYFKQASLPPDEIDPAQLQKVQAFRERLKRDGVLYCDFGPRDDFERQLRQHLTMQLRVLLRADNDTLAGAQEDGNQDTQGEDQAVDDDELGFLDYLDRAEEQFGESRVVTERMAAAITEVGDRMRQRTKELTNAIGGGTQLSRVEARAVFGRAADDMNCFSEKLSTDLPRFRDTLAEGVAATKQAAWLVPDGPERDAQLKKVIDDLGVLRDSIDPAIDGMTSFEGTVRDLPKMTKEFNVAKRRVSSVLAEVLDAMKGGRHLVRETIALLESTVSNEPAEGVE